MSRTGDCNYYRDHRNCRPAEIPKVYVCDEEGFDVEIELPWKWGVCPVCEGKGSHVNPAIDCNGLTAEDFADDPDFAESYFKGHFDQPCNLCRGRTTIPIVDEERLTPEEKEAYEEHLRCEDDGRAEQIAEMRMGA
jgi:hypothetical protein